MRKTRKDLTCIYSILAITLAYIVPTIKTHSVLTAYLPTLPILSIDLYTL